MRTQPAPVLVPLLLASVAAVLAFLRADSGLASAQAPGFAEIASPAPGQSLSGMVTIAGSANHPAFVSYDLSLGYANDETQTWFPIAESVTTPVIDGPLALWDTRGLSDETYVLRLQVLLDDGSRLEAIVPDVQVHNYTPTRPPAADKVFTPPPMIALLNAPPPTAQLGAPPAASPPAEQIVLKYLRLGMAAGVASLVAVGIVVLGRRAWRWGKAAVPRRRARRGRRRRSPRP